MGPWWASTFKDFYAGFPNQFRLKLDEGKKLKETLRPRVVKALGDELLLQAPLTGYEDAKALFRFFRGALHRYKTKNLDRDPLFLKGTAWIAGFPYNNECVSIEATQAEGGAMVDFIGPSMDTGFRISSFATPTKLAVSVDLALLLLEGEKPVELFYDGAEPMKGVLGGRPYPRIWSPVDGDESALHAAERELVGISAAPVRLRNYCKKYIETCPEKSWLIEPYFENDPVFNKVPHWHPKADAVRQQVDDNIYEMGDEPARSDTAEPK